MSATLEQFGPLVAGERFKALTPLEKAQFRDRAFQAVVASDPEKLEVFQSLPDERKAKLREGFRSRFDEAYADSFTVVTEPGKDVEYVTPGPLGGSDSLVPKKAKTADKTRPIFNTETEQFLADVEADKVDPAKFDKKTLLEVGPLVSEALPGKAGPWRERAQQIAREEFLPSDPDYARSIARVAGTVAGAVGPAVRLTDFIIRKSGLRKEDEPLFQESFQALNPENQQLLALGYPEVGAFKTGGAAMSMTGLGIRAATALQAAGVNLASRAGIAAGAGVDAAVGAIYAKEAPGILADMVGKPDSYVLNAIEAGLFSTLIGTAMRQVTKAEMLTKAREAFKFTGSDSELLDYLRDIRAKMPQQVEGTVRDVTPTAESAPAELPKLGTVENPPPKVSPAEPAPAAEPPALPADATPSPKQEPAAETAPPTGPEFSVKTPDDSKTVVRGNWRIVESDTIKTSRDDGYDAVLQPRDRSRAASRQQISQIATKLDPDLLADSVTSDLGAPIVNARGMVLSGNGRTEAIREAYGSEGKGAGYKEWLTQNADRFGMSPEDVAGMSKPVLVRQAADFGGIEEAEFARLSNRQQVLGMSDSEKAAVEGQHLIDNPDLMGKFRPSEEGDVLAATNREFLNEFIEASGERAELVSKDGQGYHPKLAGRVRNAVLSALVGPENRTLIDSLVDETESMKRVVGGLLNTSHRLIKFRGTDFDISRSITKALQDFVSIKRSGETIDDYLAQTGLFGDGARSPESDFILQALGEFKSTKAITTFLTRYAEIAGKIDTTTPDMFGSANAKPLDVLKQSASEAKGSGPVQETFSAGSPESGEGAAVAETQGADDGGGRSAGGGRGVKGNVAPAPGATAGGDLGSPKQRATAPEDDPNASKLVIELPEMVQLAKSLLGGKYPKISEQLRALRGRALGVFRYQKGAGTGEIELRADIFDLVSKADKRLLKEEAVEYARNMKAADPTIDEAAVARERYEFLLEEAYAKAMKENPKLASKVLAHEIGHLVDWLPDKMIEGRGNLFARIASLKGYTKSILPEKPGAAGELTDADRARLHREAEKLAKAEREKAGTEEEDPGVTPEEILEIWQNPAARDKSPDLYEYVAKMTPAQKKELVKAAMRGKISDWFVFKRDKMATLTKSEREFYAELLKEEIRKRRLFDLEEMKNELRPLIAWWRGTAQMEAYFEPSAEMYAESFSVLINNPAAVAKRAPRFYEAFFNYLQAKPEVKKVYDQIQSDINSGQIYRDRVRNLRDSWEAADDAGLRAEEMAAVVPFQERLDVFRLHFDRTFGPVYRRMKKAKDVDLLKTEKAIEDFLYRATAHELFLRKLNIDVLGPLTRANLSWTDLGEYMFHQHVIHNRANIASSQGFNPKASNERLEEMKGHLAPQRWAALEKGQQTYRAIYEEQVLDLLRRAQVLDPKLQELIEERSFYATMSAATDPGDVPPESIEAALRGRYGIGVTSRIYKQVGYLGDVKNPATATAQKAMSLISMAYREQAKRQIVQFLAESNDPLLQPAPSRWNGHSREPVDVVNERIGTLTYLHKGKAQSFYVPRAVYEAIENSNPIEAQIIGTFYKIVSPIKALYTELNYGFWPVAVARDLRGFVRKMPGASFALGRNPLASYLGPARAAAKASLTAQNSDLADEMLRRQMVISRAEPRGEAAADNAFERMLLRYGMNPETWRTENLSAGKKLVEAWNWYKRQGQINERMVKIAGMMYLDDQFPKMPEAIKQRLVHESAGSPNFLQRPRSGPAIDMFMLFYNPWKEGVRSHVRAWKANPWEMFAKWALYTAPLTITAWMLENGKFEDVLPKEQSDRYRDMYRSIPEYDKTGYHCIPIAWADEEQKKVLYVRLPLEENERLENGLLRKALTMGEGGEGLLSYAGGQVPGLNPVIDVAHQWFEFKVLGRNPYDSFRQRNVIRDDVFEAGQGDEAMLKHTANQLGAGLVVRFSEESLYQPPKAGVEKFLNAPVMSNLLGRWIKVSNRGLFERAENMTEDIRRERAETRIIGQEIIRKMDKGLPFTEAEKSLLASRPYLQEYIVRKMPEVMKSKSSVDMQILMQAGSTAERLKILEGMSAADQDTP